MMNIKWAPLNVPWERRLQTAAAATIIFLFVFGELLSICSFILLLYKGNYLVQAACIIYLGFLYQDCNIEQSGGRGGGSHWLRSWKIWKYFGDYFPIDLIKTVDLPANQNYLFALFPHGILSFGSFYNFNTTHSKWSELFPQIRSKFVTLNVHFFVPIFRELLLNLGMAMSSEVSITNLLKAPTSSSDLDGCTSNGVMLVVGGAREALHARPDNYSFVLKNRRGFVRIALKTGTPIVPIISFNEVNIYNQLANPPGSLVRRFQELFKSVTGISPIFFFGRGFFQYSFGWIPKRRAITTVVGAPIPVPQIDQPTPADIDSIHQKFCADLEQLFERFKCKYVENYADVKLTIV